MSSDLGVNLSGFFRSEKGVGEAARSDIRSLKAARIPFVLNPWQEPGSGDHVIARGKRSVTNPHGINLIHVNLDVFPRFRQERGASYFRDRYNIGCWAWELSAFPDGWRDRFDGLDEVWALSRFTADALRTASPIPVRTMPLSLAERVPTTPVSRRSLGIPERATVFVFVFDMHSFLERKNPLDLVAAFRKAFSPREDVHLVLKTSRAASDPDGMAAITEAARGAKVHHVDGIWPAARIDGLMRMADAYVSLHRAEGFGLTLAEAMRAGTPVIATGYSGNLEFMNPGNSLLVPHTLVPIERDHGPYRRGGSWAQPDVDAAAALMRSIVERPAEARERARVARSEILEKFSPKAVGARMRQRLEEIQAGIRGARHALGHRRPGSTPTPLPPLPRKPRCSLVIPVHDQSHLTAQCLEALLESPPRKAAWEIIVVDDASTDGTAALLARHGRRIRVVTQDANTGFSRACNRGAAEASGDLLVFLNNDTLPTPGWLDHLVDHARSHPEAGVLGSRLLFPDGSIQHAGMVMCHDGHPRHLYAGFPGDHPAVMKSRAFQAVTGACLMIRTSLFRELGGFDVGYVNGYEDVDLCLRVRDRGLEVHYCHESVLFHLQAATRAGRPAEEERNLRRFRERWGRHLVPDDLRYYATDGLLNLRYTPLCPVHLDLAPELARVVAGPGGGQESDADARLRAMQLLHQLTTENLRLAERVRELERDASPARPGKGSGKGSGATTSSARPRSQAPSLDRAQAYLRTRQRVREMVEHHVPKGATVAVVSRGDDALLRFDGRRGRHFPGDREGLYSGHHPADSAAAIALLRAARKAGASFLAFPETAAWWLSHYDGFARHLEEKCRRLDTGTGAGSLFDIRPPRATRRQKA